MNMLPRLRNNLDGEIEKTLRVSYDGLNNRKDQALFRHIACLFNGEKVNDIKLFLADSDLDVNIGLENLVDKSLIHVRHDIVKMHCLLESMGKEIVRAQSNEPGEREFLVDSTDICDLFEDNTGTKRVLGITLDMDEIDELYIHENVFKGMRNLFFLNLYNKKKKVRWHLPEGFDYLPSKLRLLRLDGYPMKCLPSNFRPENLVELRMQDSKLEKLWDEVHIFKGLKTIVLSRSKNLKKIPDLSMATNLKRLYLDYCSNLVHLPDSIKNLNQLEKLIMYGCTNLKTLPTGINLQSLQRLDLRECSKLKSFPNISTNKYHLFLSETRIKEFPSNLCSKIPLAYASLKRMELTLEPLIAILSPATLTKLVLSDIPNLVELPSSIHDFQELRDLEIINCINLETLPNGINIRYLERLELTGCTRLKKFPDISTFTKQLYLEETGIEEVPWWIEKFYRLAHLIMAKCNSLVRVSLNIYKFRRYLKVDFSDCKALTEAASWNGSQSELAMAIDVHSRVPKFSFLFLKLDPEALLNNRSIIFRTMHLSGEEVPLYFTHQTTGNSLTNIPLHQTSLPQPFLRLRVGVVFNSNPYQSNGLEIHIKCRFKSKLGNSFDSLSNPYSCFRTKLFVFDCRIPLSKDNAPLPQLSYDHVDIQIYIANDSLNDDDVTFTLKGWGIRLLEDFSSEKEIRLPNPDTLPLVWETDEDNMVCTQRAESGKNNVARDERESGS